MKHKLQYLDKTSFKTWQTFLDPLQFPNAHNCSLSIKSWSELFELHSVGNVTFTEGGMGPSAVHRIYLQWICIKDNIPWPAGYVFTHIQNCNLQNN
jgi:hypothetical protein